MPGDALSRAPEQKKKNIIRNEIEQNKNVQSKTDVDFVPNALFTHPTVRECDSDDQRLRRDMLQLSLCLYCGVTQDCSIVFLTQDLI